jgi:hypothetical protein
VSAREGAAVAEAVWEAPEGRFFAFFVAITRERSEADTTAKVAALCQ